MSADLDSLKQTFGTIAQVYDAVRPGYPDAIAARVLSQFSEPQSVSALEIGCGSGQATAMFANTGMRILGIDISPDLIALAQKRLATYPNVQFQVGAFETFDLNTTFDLIYSAQAFHWIPTEVGLPHAAHLLKHGGSLALFWNFFNYDANAELVRLRETIVRHIPLFARYPEGSPSEYEPFRMQWIDEITRTDLFKNIQTDTIETKRDYTPDDYLLLVSSHSWFQSQSEAVQQNLLQELRDAFDTNLLRFPVQTLLIIAEHV